MHSLSSTQKGDKVSGKLNSKTDFGLFIGLEDGIDGLVHVSDVDWNKSDESLLESFQKGQQIDAVILSIDTERQRVALGIKQMSGDPFSEYAASNAKGAEVTGVIAEITSGGLVIDLAQGVQGFLKRGELAQRPRVDRVQGRSRNHQFCCKPRPVKAVPLAWQFVHKKLPSSALQMQELNTKTVESEGPTTIGDLIKEQLKK